MRKENLHVFPDLKVSRSPFRRNYTIEKANTVARIFLRGLAALVVVGGGYLAFDKYQETRAQQFKQEWAAGVKDVLSGNNKPLEGEQLVDEVVIVPAGQDLKERLEMKSSRTPVNVRDYSGLQDPVTNRETSIVGKIDQGAKIKRVLMVKGQKPLSPQQGRWAAFDCSSAQIKDDNGKQVEVEKGKVCAVYEDYVQKTGK